MDQRQKSILETDKEFLILNEIPVKQLSEAVLDAVVITDMRGHIRFTNQKAEKMFGYQQEELLGKLVEILIPSRFPKHSQYREDYSDHPRPRPMGSNLDLFALRKDGNEFPVAVSLSSLSAGNKTVIVAIIRDITQQKLSDQNLRRSEARNRALLAAIPDMMFRVHRSGIVWDYKAGGAATRLISSEAFLGKRLSETLPADMAEQMMAAIERVVVTGGRQAFEYGLQVEKEERHFETWVAPSNPDEFIIIIRDITRLKKVEERYRITLDNMLEGCQIIDFDWRYLYVNDTVARQGHAKPEDLVNLTMMEVYPGIENTDMFHLLEHCMEKRVPANMENEFVFPDGATGWFELRIQPVPEGLFILSMDITERKRSEIELNASEDRYRDLVENSQDLICTHDLEGNLLTINPYAGSVLGYTIDDLLQMNLRDILTPEAIDAFDAYLADIQTHGSADGLMWVQTKSGEKRIWEYKNSLRTKGVDRPIVRGIARDVTEKKRYEEALRTEKERFTTLAATVPGVIWSFRMHPDRSISIPYASPAIEDIFGLKAEDLIDDFSPAMDRIPPDDFEYVMEGMVASARTLASWRIDCRYNHPSKGEIWLEGHSTPIPEPDGSVTWHGFVVDITERKRTETEVLRQANYLKALRNIDIAISSSLDIRLVLNVILNEISRQLKCDSCDVLLLERETFELEVAGSHGFHFEKQSQDIHLHLGESMAGQVALKRKLLHIPDLTQFDDVAIRKPLFEEEGFQVYFGVPLIAKGELAGVLEVFHRSPFEPEPSWMEFLDMLAGQAAIAIDNATLLEDLQNTNQELIMAYDKTLEGWSAALDLRDKETEGHTQRVTNLTLKLAKRMGINKQELVHVRRGALLHDIGKMGVPDRILLKPDKLTEDEWEIMRKHPVFAYELLKPISYLKPALAIPHYHHEKWDGSGYPSGLSGEDIPLPARIFAVIDVYDALTSERPYRDAWSEEKTLEYIQSLSSSHFDPDVVAAFRSFLREEQQSGL